MNSREQIIGNYVEGYNQFDVDKMVLHFAENILFENVSNGEINLALTGLSAFREQAERAIAYFTVRRQTITSIKHIGNQTEIDVDYYAVLKADFPNGLKKGDELRVQGKSVFTFLNEKIIKLTDVA
ncbi:hypothetical protein GCM10023189_34810 [Nibrella saemangeumensis]|uniref:SnoaL-like domain-containing protein n=1 Tax=Nibrella saemangeumensis TaxID=1084526 RepID=A0ABP8N2E6_9BACT